MPDQLLDGDDLNNILLGAALLGSGGGGPIAAGQEIIKEILSESSGVMLADAMQVPDDGWMAISAFAGSPDSAAGSSFSFGKVAQAAYDTLEKTNGKPFTHVIGAEPGAGNTFIPMAVAARKNIPLVDATGAPRAIPEIPMVTFASHNVPVSPVVMANESHQVVITVDNVMQVDPIIRGVISNNPEFGQEAGVALWSMSGATMKSSAIKGMITTMWRLGKFIRTQAQSSPDPAQTVADYLNGYVLFKGMITDVQESSTGGFDFGTITVESGSSKYVVYNQNENMIAWDTSRPTPLCIAPDLMCWITTQGQPFSNVEAGSMADDKKEVALIGIKAPPDFADDFMIGLFVAALRSLGYGGPYVPLSDLVHG